MRKFKPITRQIRITAGGRATLATSRRITIAQAERECPKTAERLLTKGDSISMTRRLNRCCTVTISYTAHADLIQPRVMPVRIDMAGTKAALREIC